MRIRHSYKRATDEDVMVAVKGGDTSAFSELYDRYANRLAHYFAKMLWNDREKAMDMTQDLFTKIVEKPDSYRSGMKVSTWLYTIASNMCKNEYRHHEVRNRHADKVKIEWTKNEFTGHKDIDEQGFKEQLNEELSKMSHDKRSTFIMRYKQGLSIREIADVMQCSEGTVKSRLFYTLKDLSNSLRQFDPKAQ